MKDPKKIFQVVSYLQYPLMLSGLYFVLKPYFNDFENIFKDFNSAFIFMGLGISFSTLQDTTKTQNNFSKRIWENPKKGKQMITFMAIMAFSIIAFGIFGYFISKNGKLQELSFGFIVLGIGFVGMLKTAIEMFENHRKDKNL